MIINLTTARSYFKTTLCNALYLLLYMLFNIKNNVYLNVNFEQIYVKKFI